jgi:hypothetical protein
MRDLSIIMSGMPASVERDRGRQAGGLFITQSRNNVDGGWNKEILTKNSMKPNKERLSFRNMHVNQTGGGRLALSLSLSRRRPTVLGSYTVVSVCECALLKNADNFRRLFSSIRPRSCKSKNESEIAV